MTTPRWLRRQIISKKHRRRLVFLIFFLKQVEEPRMGANGLNHEWTRNTRKEKPEPRMDTNVHEWIEPRMGANGLNHEPHEIHEKKAQNHEWTRMGTKGLNHEWTRMDTNIIIQWNGVTALQIIPEQHCSCVSCVSWFKRTSPGNTVEWKCVVGRVSSASNNSPCENSTILRVKTLQFAE